MESRGSEKSRVLLSTPTATRVVMFLIQHKEQLVNKRIKTISVFRDDSVRNDEDWERYKGPTLLFELENGN